MRSDGAIDCQECKVAIERENDVLGIFHQFSVFLLGKLDGRFHCFEFFNVLLKIRPQYLHSVSESKGKYNGLDHSSKLNAV